MALPFPRAVGMLQLQALPSGPAGHKGAAWITPLLPAWRASDLEL